MDKCAVWEQSLVSSSLRVDTWPNVRCRLTRRIGLHSIKRAALRSRCKVVLTTCDICAYTAQMTLNAQSPIPLYRQLADLILADIESGRHGVDTRIPSENELAEQFQIGRPTVRQATDLLVRHGRLERRRGSGTFVLPPNRSIDVLSLAGTSAALQQSQLESSLEVLSGPVRESSTEFDSEVFRIERRAVVDGAPVLYEKLLFDSVLFTDLDKQLIKQQSISALVRDVYFLEPSSADQMFYVIQSDTEIAKHLNIKEGMPLLRVRRALHFGQHQCALLAEIVCLTDRFEFSQTLYPANADTGFNT